MTNPTHSKTFQANVDPSIPDDVIDRLLVAYKPDMMPNGFLLPLAPPIDDPVHFSEWDCTDKLIDHDCYEVVNGFHVDKGMTNRIVAFRRVGNEH